MTLKNTANKRNECDQITNYINPKKLMNTEYGIITGEEWLKRECKRIGTKSRPVVILDNNDQKSSKSGFLAIFKNY